MAQPLAERWKECESCFLFFFPLFIHAPSLYQATATSITKCLCPHVSLLRVLSFILPHPSRRVFLSYVLLHSCLSDPSPLLFFIYKRYPWLQLAGEERKAAVAERRTVLLTQILALDAPAGDQGYVCARVCATVRPLLQERRAMESGERKKR